MFENFLSNCTWWLLPLLLLAFLLGMLFWHLLKVSGLLDRIKGLESDNGNLNTRISGLEGDLNAKSSALLGLQGDYDGLNTKYNGLNGRFTTVQADYLAERKAKGEVEVELEDWKGRFATIETDLTTEKTNYASLQAKYDTDLTVEREAKLAYESDLGTWKSKFTGIEGKLALATAAVATWKATSGDLEGKYSKLEKDVEVSNNDWNLKWTNLENEYAAAKEAHVAEINGWNIKFDDYKTQVAAEKEVALKAEADAWNLKFGNYQTEAAAEKEAAVIAERNAWSLKWERYQKQASIEQDEAVTAERDAWNLKWTNYLKESAAAKEEAVTAERNAWNLKWGTYQNQVAIDKDEAVKAEREAWSLKWTNYQKEVEASKAAAIAEESKNRMAMSASLEKDYKSKVTDLETDLVGWRNKYSVLEKSIDQRCLDAAKVFYGKVKKDDLTVVEGIGPKIQGLLQDAGIDTWYKLWQSEYDTLKKVLTDAGSRYQMHDPQTWSEQAKLCYYCQWAKLKQWQDELDGGNVVVAKKEISADEKKTILAGAKKFYPRVKWDDLKVVEGIGPKIEGLCHDIGIKTWKALSEAKYDTLKKMLKDAGPRYQMHDPKTWPLQSGMAHKAEWKKLKEWQDSHSHGRA